MLFLEPQTVLLREQKQAATLKSYSFPLARTPQAELPFQQVLGLT